MKLAFVVCGKSPTTMPGGLGSYSYNIAKIFHESGYKVHLIGYGDSNHTTELPFGSLHQIKNPFIRIASFGNFLIIPKMVTTLCDIIENHDADEIIIFGAAIWGKVAIDVKNINKLSNKKITTIASYFTTYKHEYEGQVKGAPIADYGVLYNLILRALLFITSIYHSRKEHYILNNIDTILVHYESAIEIITNEFTDIDTLKIEKIPYYIDIYDRTSNVQSDNNTNKTKIKITTICRHDPRKGINSLLKALKILSYTDLEFECVIAGNGFFLKKHIELSIKLGISDFVSFPGFIKSTEDLLNSSDIFVLSSIEEGSGAVSLLEAMKCGVPIVTTDCDGIPEDFVHNFSAILVETHNVESLAQGLEKLMRDKELRNYISMNAKNEFNKRFSFGQMKNGLNNCLMKINDTTS
ncbi:MAG: glycosyltransferase involved in cell wall biosynthesis [Gammaproteobacteria bacterium]|jgi:glycosyltransferase involved in cell wall biosynthesis